jgi:hypothetical protein
VIDFIRGFFTAPLLFVLFLSIIYVLFPPGNLLDRPFFILGLFGFLFALIAVSTFAAYGGK